MSFLNIGCESGIVYQVRLFKTETDEGEVLAIFKDVKHCAVMHHLAIPEGQTLGITKYVRGIGVVELIDIDTAQNEDCTN